MPDPLVIVADSIAEADKLSAWLTGALAARPGLRVRRDGVSFEFFGEGAAETVKALVRQLAAWASEAGLAGAGGDA